MGNYLMPSPDSNCHQEMKFVTESFRLPAEGHCVFCGALSGADSYERQLSCMESIIQSLSLYNYGMWILNCFHDTYRNTFNAMLGDRKATSQWGRTSNRGMIDTRTLISFSSDND